ncbi:hypothetical protein [Streptomyces sp. AK02-01A]|uniref:hypothetical protein n=1 Tax=Streptomyces sp. AK02-01A TaxID=3028648 RepID=UPI0029AA1687|nr:hypothetical protein [Streptomyces sp. AK02-01A]MDX3850336.1 hypothetical protein [Streptomyces sp. AK02-01A]
MAIHAPTRARHRVSPRPLALPILLGVIYGVYAQFIARGGGAATYGQLALALISGAAVAVLVFTLDRIRDVISRELRAAAYGTLVGGAMGFLYSLTGHSVMLSSAIGLALGVSTVIVAFYFFHTREP